MTSNEQGHYTRMEKAALVAARPNTLTQLPTKRGRPSKAQKQARHTHWFQLGNKGYSMGGQYRFNFYVNTDSSGSSSAQCD